MKRIENVADFKIHDKDRGSSEYQVAIFTKRINHLTSHFRIHKHDHHSRRGLLRIVARRRRILKYLHYIDIDRYKNLIAKLGLRK